MVIGTDPAKFRMLGRDSGVAPLACERKFPGARIGKLSAYRPVRDHLPPNQMRWPIPDQLLIESTRMFMHLADENLYRLGKF